MRGTARRRAEGRAARRQTSRSALGQLAKRPEGYDSVSRLLSRERDARTDLLALRVTRMLDSPLAFLRGSALLMAEDLARGVSSPLVVQLCGDAHLANFGVSYSPERRLVFDVNDFDETAPGPFEWDVKRLAASVAIVGEQLGLKRARRREVVIDLVREYQRTVHELTGMKRLDAWYLAFDVTPLTKKLRRCFREDALERADRLLRDLRPAPDTRAYRRFVKRFEAGPLLRSRAPHLVPERDLGDDAALVRRTVDVVMDRYPLSLTSDRAVLLSQFDVRDVARQIVGVGSVGREVYVVALTGRDDGDLFLLQVKEARPSAVAAARTQDGGDAGQRVVEGQRLLQARPDPFLGWHTMDGPGGRSSFYVRQLYDHRAAIDLTRLDRRGLRAYARACAWVLARAHARGPDAARIAGYLGRGEVFADAIADFAEAYRKRNLRDYAALNKAARQGRVPVIR